MFQQNFFLKVGDYEFQKGMYWMQHVPVIIFKARLALCQIYVLYIIPNAPVLPANKSFLFPANIFTCYSHLRFWLA